MTRARCAGKGRPAAKAAGLTVANVVALYIADPDVAKLRSVTDIARVLQSQFVEFIGNVAVTDLTRRQIVECT